MDVVIILDDPAGNSFVQVTPHPTPCTVQHVSEKDAPGRVVRVRRGGGFHPTLVVPLPHSPSITMLR